MIAALHRSALRLAYRLMRLYWALFRAQVRGALVTVWYRGEVLVLRNSYRRAWSLPGGGIRARESAREAARRELREEIGLEVREDELALAKEVHLEWEGKRDHVHLFALRLQAPPSIAVDGREVLEARFFPPEAALELDLIPPARHAIQHEMESRRKGPPASSLPLPGEG